MPKSRRLPHKEGQTHTHTHTLTHKHTHTLIHAYTCTHLYTHTHVRAHLYAHTELLAPTPAHIPTPTLQGCNHNKTGEPVWGFWTRCMRICRRAPAIRTKLATIQMVPCCHPTQQ